MRKSVQQSRWSMRSVARRCWQPLWDVEEATDMARGFSALADPARLRILSILAAAPEGEVCVCDLIEPVGKSQPTISHHLKSLGDAGLVHGDRRASGCGTPWTESA